MKDGKYESRREQMNAFRNGLVKAVRADVDLINLRPKLDETLRSAAMCGACWTCWVTRGKRWT